MTREELVVKWAKGPKILDVGCTDQNPRFDSVYWLHRHLYDNFPYVVGIDIDENKIELMHQAGYKNLFVQNAESFELGEKFDTIVVGEVIEHLANPGMFLEKAVLHLAPGGRLIITTQNPFSLLHSLYALFKFPKTCQNNEHTCWYCLETMRNLLKRYGFQEEHLEPVMDFEFTDPSWRYRLLGRLMQIFAPFLPQLWKMNTMFFVFTHD